MASSLIFDMADPGIKKLVDGWADNTEYAAMVTVRAGAGPQRNVAEVTSFEPDEMMDEEPVEEVAAPAPEPKLSSKMPAIKYK